MRDYQNPRVAFESKKNPGGTLKALVEMAMLRSERSVES
jgi:hypothetical protein